MLSYITPSKEGHVKNGTSLTWGTLLQTICEVSKWYSHFLLWTDFHVSASLMLDHASKKKLGKNFWKMFEVFLTKFIFYSVHMLKWYALLKDYYYYKSLISSGQPCFKATNWRLMSLIACVTHTFQVKLYSLCGFLHDKRTVIYDLKFCNYMWCMLESKLLLKVNCFVLWEALFVFWKSMLVVTICLLLIVKT